jgi:hypothetical protein
MAANRVLLICLPALIISSCTKMSESEKQSRFLSSINAASDVMSDAPSASPISDIEGQLLSNIPSATYGGDKLEQKAICGNGIIEGDEYCDGDNVQDRKCTDFLGISGPVACAPNCKLDVSRCITPAVDEKIGGIAEVCKCTCNNDNCEGGCTTNSLDLPGFADCFFRCDNNCTCRCEGKTETHIEYCNITCQCVMNPSGQPDCFCNLDECELLTFIVPNIAELSSRKAIFPLSR